MLLVLPSSVQPSLHSPGRSARHSAQLRAVAAPPHTATEDAQKRLLLSGSDADLDSLSSLDDAQIQLLEEMYLAAAASEVCTALGSVAPV